MTISPRRTPTLDSTVTIRATRETLWRVWTDVPAWPTWDTPLRRAELPTPFEVGARGRLTDAAGRVSIFTVTVVTPGQAYTFETVLPLARLVIERVVTAERADTLEVTHRIWFTGPLAPLWRRVLGPGFRAQLPDVLAKLRNRAEGVS